MHLNCERHSEFCKKEEENFYANVLKFVRGESASIPLGIDSEVRAKIAKNLIS